MFQYTTCLYKWSFEEYLKDLIYQILLSKFSHYDSRFVETDQLIVNLSKEMIPKLSMLQEYFGIIFEKVSQNENLQNMHLEGYRLVQFPVLFDMCPDGKDLFDCITRFSEETKYHHEKACFYSILMILSDTLAKIVLLRLKKSPEEGREFYSRYIEATIKTMPFYPPSSNLTRDNNRLEKLTDLRDLYKVFERC